MRFSARLLALILGCSAAASAAVVERVAVSPSPALSPAPIATLALPGPLAASFAPGNQALVPWLALPAPAVLPSIAAPAAPLEVSAAPAEAPAPAASAEPAGANRERGPPTARDAGFSAFVADDAARTVRDWGVPSAELLADHDAIVVGENHQSLASVTELSRALPGLAKAGVKVLGIEGLKRPSQNAVDDYLSGASDVLDSGVLSFSPARRAAFETLLKTARGAGVRVVALGLPLDAWSRQAAELAALKTGDPIETFPRDPGEQVYRAQVSFESGYNDAVAEVYLTRRNETMASFLAAAMAEGAKAVVLAGQNHVDGDDRLTFNLLAGRERWGSLGTELARRGLKAFSLTLTGGLFTSAESASDDRAARPASYERAARLSPAGAPAFERTGASTGLYHAGGTVPSRAPSRARR